MIHFEEGWDWSNIGRMHVKKRQDMARRLNARNAERLIRGTARELVRTGAGTGWLQTFANAVLFTHAPSERHHLDAYVEKGLHQEEGSVFDATAHITIRCCKKAFHLYVQIIDPPLGKSSYELKVTGLSYQQNRKTIDYELSELSEHVDSVST